MTAVTVLMGVVCASVGFLVAAMFSAGGAADQLTEIQIQQRKCAALVDAIKKASAALDDQSGSNSVAQAKATLDQALNGHLRPDWSWKSY